MKPNSDAIPLLVSLVRVRERWFGRGVVYEPPELATVADVLRRLVDLGDWRVLPFISWLLGSRDADVCRAAAKAVERLMPSDARSLGMLDAGMRSQSRYYVSWWPNGAPYPGLSSSIDDVKRVLSLALPTSALGLCSFSPDGHAREAAVQGLDAIRDGSELPFLLLRLNDWVSQVSTRATTAVAGRCNADYAEHFARWLPLVDRVKRGWRAPTDLVEWVERLLAETEPGRASISKMLAESKEVAVRRAAADLVSRRAEGDLPEVIVAALDDPDGVLRGRAADAAFRLTKDEQLAPLLAKLSRDSSSRIRARVLETAAKRRTDLVEGLALELIFDSNVWVRLAARQYLPPGTDVAERYRAAVVAGTKNRRGALAGLADVGGAQDVDLVRKYVNVGNSSSRQTALRTLVKLDPRAAAEPLVHALSSEFAGVAKTAMELIRRGNPYVFASDVVPLLEHASPHIRRSGLSALGSLGRWDALVGALQLHADPDERVRDVSRGILLHWQWIPRELYTAPTPEQAARLRELLTPAPAGLERVAQTVTAILGRE